MRINNIIVLYLKSSLLEDAESRLAKLSSYTETSLKLLTASVVPQASSTARADSEHFLKLTVYGFTNDEKLVEAKELKE